jgi:plastocyanin
VRPLLVTTAAGLALVLTGCVEPSAGTPSSADLADFGVQSQVAVDLDEDGFSPDSLDLGANSTVSVTNTGDDSHGVLQVDTAPDRRVETGDLLPGETVDIHLIDPGAVELVDPRTGATLTLDVRPAAPID